MGKSILVKKEISIDRIGKIYLLLWCSGVALAFLLFTSMNSPFYPLQVAPDQNTIFTVARSAIEGRVPYRDVFDHKGPIFYLINIIGAFISKKSFLGMFLLEVANLSATLYYGTKLSLLLSLNEERYNYYVAVVFAFAITSSTAFSEGGILEEYMLFPLMYTFFSVVDLVKNDHELRKSQLAILGVFWGVIFWSKYTICGLPFGALIIISIWYAKRKKLFYELLMIASGYILTCLVVIVWFAAQDALSDLIQVYFIDNIFKYGHAMDTFERSIMIIKAALISYKNNIVPSLLSTIGLLGIWKKDKSIVKVLFMCVLPQILLCWGGGNQLAYQGMIFFVYSPFGIIILIERISIQNEQLKQTMLLPLLCVILLSMAFFGNPFKQLLFANKNSLPQYMIAEMINSTKEESETSLICYGMGDWGYFVSSGIKINQKYFCKIQLRQDELLSAQKDVIANGEVEFFVCPEKFYGDYEKYDLVGQYNFIWKKGCEPEKVYAYHRRHT